MSARRRADLGSGEKRLEVVDLAYNTMDDFNDECCRCRKHARRDKDQVS